MEPITEASLFEQLEVGIAACQEYLVLVINYRDRDEEIEDVEYYTSSAIEIQQPIIASISMYNIFAMENHVPDLLRIKYESIMNMMRIINLLEPDFDEDDFESYDEEDFGENVPVGYDAEELKRCTALVTLANCNDTLDQSSCSICLDEFSASDTLRKLGCGHLFHETCTQGWFCKKKTCPLCITDIMSKPISMKDVKQDASPQNKRRRLQQYPPVHQYIQIPQGQQEQHPQQLQEQRQQLQEQPQQLQEQRQQLQEQLQPRRSRRIMGLSPL